MHEAYNLKFLKDMECIKHIISEGYEMPEAYNPWRMWKCLKYIIPEGYTILSNKNFDMV